jgi:hypothetical protein
MAVPRPKPQTREVPMPKFEITMTAQIPKAHADDIDRLHELYAQFGRFIDFVNMMGTVKTSRIEKYEKGKMFAIM